MIYRGGSRVSNADCITAIRDEYFVTGHDDGVLSLWLRDKKRAVVSVSHAHGFCASAAGGGASASAGGASDHLARGIVSCASLGGSDLAATGSNDGYLRLWKVSTGEKASDRGLENIGKVPLFGYINDIAIGPKGRFCVAAVGQEPRLGRWDRVAGAKNRFAIVQLTDAVDETHDDDDDDDDDANGGESDGAKEDSSNDSDAESMSSSD